jgi:hypothetical protein
MAVQTMRRRILLIGGSGALSTTAPALGAVFTAGGDAFAGAEGDAGAPVSRDAGGAAFDVFGDSS